ncbi:unnamed protein product, partial [Hydatigera taeniaeformis]|uniref:KxDL domain-containing protein n=1 Tax=Hydatigena taeniaeformis TaxID=6205 RepID=A0A0R3WV73_HYDTA
MEERDTGLIESTLDQQAFARGLRHEDLSNILLTQHNLLSRLEKTNAMLQTLNELSNHRLDLLASQLRANTRLLISMKRELVTILRRAESMKKTLMNQYPPEYELASGTIESSWKAELEAESRPSSDVQPSTLFHPMIPLTDIALSAFSDLILFDVLFLLVALVSIWVRQQTADVRSYCFGYDRFEVIAVFASTILSILSSFYLLKEAVERLFDPVVVAVEYMPWATLVC